MANGLGLDVGGMQYAVSRRIQVRSLIKTLFSAYGIRLTACSS